MEQKNERQLNMSKISEELNSFGEFPNSGDNNMVKSSNTDGTNLLSKQSTTADVKVWNKAIDLREFNDVVNNKMFSEFNRLIKNKEDVKTPSQMQGKEVVDSPEHYHSRIPKKKMQHIIDRIVERGYLEAIDVIEAWDMNFNCGSAQKYILRLGMKDDAITEIDKAIKYLEFEKEMRLQSMK